jgi:hypothetical protein
MTDRGSRIVSRGLPPALAMALALVMALALSVTSGCAKRQSSMGKPPEINPPPKVEASAGKRSDELGELSRRFGETAQKLPGGTPQEHRRLMQQVFAELTQVLPVLYGPNPPGTFRQQVRIVENARTQLGTAPQTLAIEPTVDTALRAARDALESPASRTYFDQAQLGQSVDRLNASVAALDAARGPAHQEAAAASAEAMAQVIRQMSDAMSQRLNEAATQPAQEAQPAQQAQPVPDR